MVQLILSKIEDMCGGDLALMDDVAESIRNYTHQTREMDNEYQMKIKGFND